MNDAIKEYRIFSISAFIFTAYLLYTVINWMVTKSDPSGIGDGVALTGVLGSLTALCKFIFEFAVTKSNDKHTRG